jgi:hypothetical protein
MSGQELVMWLYSGYEDGDSIPNDLFDGAERLPDVRAGRGAGSSLMPYANIWPLGRKNYGTNL